MSFVSGHTRQTLVVAQKHNTQQQSSPRFSSISRQGSSISPRSSNYSSIPGDVCQVFCGVLASLHITCMQVHAESLTPYQRGLQLQYGLTADQRIRKCDAGAQPNCVSTSSGTTRLYASPFLAENAATPQAAMDDFDQALKTMYNSSKVELIESSSVEGNGLYRRYAVPSALVDKDYVEILIHENKEVFYRSQGSSTKYIWPIQQPVSDLDAQRKRMAMLRETLGWKLLVGSCSVLECYEYWNEFLYTYVYCH